MPIASPALAEQSAIEEAAEAAVEATADAVASVAAAGSKVEGTAENASIIQQKEETRLKRKEAFDFKPSPALWKIGDADSTVYLFAAIKGVPQPIKWQSEAFNRALQNADNIYFETPHIQRRDRKSRRQYEREAFHKLIRHDRDRIEDRFAPGLFNQIQDDLRIAETIGDFMPTWLVLTMVAGSDRMFQPGQSNRYLDFRIANAVLDRDVTVGGLEDPSYIIDTLNKVGEKKQRKWLNSFVRTELAADQSKRYKARKHGSNGRVGVLSARESQGVTWAKGLPPTAEATMPAGLNDLFQKIRTARMKKWPLKITAMLDQPGTSLVIVDQQYLYGENNLRTALEARGYMVDLME
ncbi:MAG: TraB/GumN family protein [Parasphingorhabdus sp.]